MENVKILIGAKTKKSWTFPQKRKRMEGCRTSEISKNRKRSRESESAASSTGLQLPKSSSSVKDGCTICLESLDHLGQTVTTFNCKHGFHQGCLRGFRDDRCPNCRKPITSEDGVAGELVEEFKRRKKVDQKEREDDEEDARRLQMQNIEHIIRTEVEKELRLQALNWTADQLIQGLATADVCHTELHLRVPFMDCTGIKELIADAHNFIGAGLNVYRETH